MVHYAAGGLNSNISANIDIQTENDESSTEHIFGQNHHNDTPNHPDIFAIPEKFCTSAPSELEGEEETETAEEDASY